MATSPFSTTPYPEGSADPYRSYAWDPFSPPLPSVVVSDAQPASDAAIALITCDQPRYQHRLEVALRTWFPHLASEYDIFVATGRNLSSVVGYAVPDDYRSLPKKMSAVFRLVYVLGYGGMWKVDDDSIVYPGLPRPGSDYCGRVLGAYSSAVNHHRHVGAYCSGGAYWLSRRSLQVMAEADPEDWTIEDGWVGRVLWDHGIRAEDSDLVGYYTDRRSGIPGKYVLMQCPDVIGRGGTKRLPPGEVRPHGKVGRGGGG
jgi:hypothetical protein